MRNQRKYSNAEIIDALRKCYELNHNSISLALYSSTIAYPSPDLIKRRFGSWNQALEQAGLPISRKRKHRETDRDFKYSKEYVIRQLRDCYEVHGELTSTFYDKKGYAPCSRTVSLQFGSWKAAVEATGVPVETGNPKQYSMEEAIIQLRSFYIENNYQITKRSYNESGRSPKPDTLRKYFGSWNQALEKAGIPATKAKKKSGLSKEEMLQALKGVYEENKGIITKSSYADARKSPTVGTIERAFGSWSDALIQAGIDPFKSQEARYTNEELLNILRGYYEVNGHLSMEDYKESGQKPTSATIVRRFGSWGNAMREAGLEMDKVEKRYTREDIIAEIRRCYEENGKKVSVNLYLYGEYKPTLTTINKVFGSWKKAVAAAGLNE